MLREFGVVASHVSAGHSLEAVDESAEFHGRGKRYEQVYVVGFAVEFLQPAVERGAHVGEYAFQRFQMLVGKHVVPVFGDEDQVRVQIVDAVPSLTNIVCLIHKDQV